MKKIFILNGSGGVGKDTFVSFVKAYVTSIKNDLAIGHTSSINYVKDVASNIGWRGEKDEKGRKFLSDIKLALSEYDDSPYERVKRKALYFLDDDRFINGVLFIDIREPEEIERAKKEFDAQTILITSDRIEQVVSNMADARVYDYEYDIIIDNSGTLEDLFDAAIEFSKEYIFEKE